MSESARQEPERKRLTASNFESSVDKQIREAMERGDFENLRNRGKPLDLARDPNVPEDWELAFNLLKGAGYAPDWIESKKELERDREKLFAPLREFLKNPPADPERFQQRQAQLVDEFRARARELNRVIDTYNLKAPSDQVHLFRIRAEDEIERFREGRVRPPQKK